MPDDPADLLTQSVQRHVAAREAARQVAEDIARQRIEAQQREVDRGSGTGTGQ